MSDKTIAFIVFAPLIIIFIGAVLTNVKKLKKAGEMMVGFGSTLAIIWIIIFVCFACNGRTKEEKEQDREMDEIFRRVDSLKIEFSKSQQVQKKAPNFDEWFKEWNKQADNIIERGRLIIKGDSILALQYDEYIKSKYK